MTRGWKAAVSRRPVLSGILAVFGIAVAGGIAVEAPGLLRRGDKPSPFDDLLARLPDRIDAGRVGAAVVAETPGFSAVQTARRLRAKLAPTSLSDTLSGDLAQDRMVEIRGWILPETLADLCALAM
jgi:hypothetical protein